MEKTIIEVVEEDPALWAEVEALVDEKYIIAGILDPRAYLLDDEQSRSKWKTRKRQPLRRIDWVAIGVTIWNQFFHDVFADHQAGGDGSPRQVTSDWLAKWEEAVAREYETCSGDDSVPEVASRLGQYLEFRNRKSQGF